MRINIHDRFLSDFMLLLRIFRKIAKHALFNGGAQTAEEPNVRPGFLIAHKQKQF